MGTIQPTLLKLKLSIEPYDGGIMDIMDRPVVVEQYSEKYNKKDWMNGLDEQEVSIVGPNEIPGMRCTIGEKISPNLGTKLAITILGPHAKNID